MITVDEEGKGIKKGQKSYRVKTGKRKKNDKLISKERKKYQDKTQNQHFENTQKQENEVKSREISVKGTGKQVLRM